MHGTRCVVPQPTSCQNTTTGGYIKKRVRRMDVWRTPREVPIAPHSATDPFFGTTIPMKSAEKSSLLKNPVLPNFFEFVPCKAIAAYRLHTIILYAIFLIIHEISPLVK